jgi:non-specific serine/threonine protein kinase/serine/threonine-protein kinase
MTPEEWRRVKAILEDALERPSEERYAYIDCACGEDLALREHVRALARAAEGDGGMLDATDAVAAGAEVPEPPGRAGERVGAYELELEIARGGMGVVYLARRADAEFQKKAAIKLMRPGLIGEADLRRFKSERQIAATLDHPNIARLLDGGTTAAGEPYFVMEYVEGRPLLEFCRTQRLSLRARLDLFRRICDAVQYAHQHLVVHRDLKPGNILVTEDGTPKLLDFGIAKLMSEEGGGLAEPTATFERVLTPEYASPEQVRGRPVTTASDVYSLGVILYELVTDDKPYRIDSSDPAELVRLVCERDPERPSTRTPGLSGDLDAIVLKAMRKEPEHRYPSAAALSDDLGRYLEGRPIEARRGSAGYRARKFVRRHRVGVLTTTLVFAAMAAGIWATLREARRARAAEARAERRFNDVRKLANSFLFEFHDAIQDLPGATAARALVVRRALEYLDSLSKESSGDRTLRRELAEAYRRVGDVQGNPFMPNLGDERGAAQSYGKAIALLEPVASGSDATDAERATLATTYLEDAGLTITEGRAEAALAMSRKGLALREDLARRKPDDADRQMDLAQAWQYVAFDANLAGKRVEAGAALDSQRGILETQARARPSDRGVRRNLAQNLYVEGELATNSGDRPAALERYREAERIQERLVEEEPASVTYRRDLGYTLTQVGNAQESLSDAAGALEVYRRALAVFEAMAAADPKSTDALLGVAMSRHNAGEALERLGRRSEALVEYRRARPAYESVIAASPSSAWVSGMLGDLYTDTADADLATGGAEACGLYSKAVEVLEPMSAAGTLTEKRRQTFDRARGALRACMSTSR